jgi:hypothetical protein
MPIVLERDDAAGIVYSTAKGIVNLVDVEVHLRAKFDAQVLTWPEVFDARDVTLDLSMRDLNLIAEHVRQAMADKQPAPIAVVTNSGFVQGLAKAYGLLIADQNPAFAVFPTLDEARQWICAHAKMESL